MELKTIILGSEEEFRNFLISNSNSIYKFVIFEDELDKIIFFYCIYKNQIIVATKESTQKPFTYFKNLYLKISNELLFISFESGNQIFAINILI